jgi:hypothetical protein
MFSGISQVIITKKGRDPIQWIKEVSEKIHFELQNQIKLSADATAEIMKRILMGSGYKLDKLADAINAEVLDYTDGISVGIGRISDLPKGQDGKDYWNAFNDGWLPPPNFGFFTSGSGMSGDKTRPMAGASGQKWIHTGKTQGSFYMLPHKPIEPLKYVDIGYEDLKAHLNKEIDKFLKSL